MTHNSNVELADEAVATELARANLARLRGDYVLAEEQCVALLHKAPHDANVAALLGDVSVEQGKLEAAVQWYEMALDSGAPTGIEEKLNATKDRIKHGEVVASEAGIGLPARSLFSPATLLAGVVVVLFLLVAAYVAGTSRTPAKPAGSQEQPPIVVPTNHPTPPQTAVQQQPAESTNPKTDVPATTNEPVASPQPITKTGIDADLVAIFNETTGPLSRVSRAETDPRSHVVVLEVPLVAGDDARAVAATVAEAVLPKLKDAPSVTVRIVSAGKPEFVADATREKLDAYRSSGRTAGTGAELADALLSNEWKSPSEAPPTGR